MKNKIKVSSELNEIQKALEVSKQLLSSNLLKIGKSEALEVTSKKIELEIQIEDAEPEMKTCTVCETHFQKGFSIYTNIGGTNKKLEYCSQDCCDKVSDLLGIRAAKKKTELKYFRTR